MNIRSMLRSSRTLRRVRRAAFRLAGFDPRLALDAREPTTLLGGEGGYGGWYVATAVLPARPTVLSLGIGTDASFDVAMIRRFGARVVGCDPTPSARSTVHATGMPKSSLTLLDFAVSDFDGIGECVPVMVSGRPTGCFMLVQATGADSRVQSVQVRSIGGVITDWFGSAPDVLKVDIEGAEFPLIESLESSGFRPGQVLVEFHHRFAGRSVRDTCNAVTSLRSMGYKLVKLSDQGPEHTFVHERLV